MGRSVWEFPGPVFIPSGQSLFAGIMCLHICMEDFAVNHGDFACSSSSSSVTVHIESIQPFVPAVTKI